MYILNIEKSETASAEEFELAINCAVTSIESTLENESLSVTLNGNKITICNRYPEEQLNIDLSEWAEKLNGCFRDSEKSYIQSSLV